MSVFKRPTSSGLTQEYHYRFMQSGKLYHGVCENCFKQDEALEFEKNIKQTAKNLTVQKSVKAIVENFKLELQGGDRIALSNAFELSLKKPRKKQPSANRIKFKRSYWRDFTDFMTSNFPDVLNLANVQKKHAEEYIQQIREKGRFNKQVIFKNHRKNGKPSKYSRKGNLSNASCNVIQQTLCEVFDKLSKDAGLIENPFRGIEKLNNNYESREAFTESELKLILNSWDLFIRRIFMTGLFTALREGDICTLRKNEIDFQNKIIRRKLLKTGKLVEIPIMKPLEAFLHEEILLVGDSEYVFPELAKMYLENSGGISYRVKNFLESLGIKTCKKVAGRDRLVSVKDVHSLRHTFCYFAGLNGIPLVVVQSIVGHMDSKMTSHYSAHADRQAKHSKMLLFPDFIKQFDSGITIDVKAIESKSLSERISEAIELIREIRISKANKDQLLTLLATG